jgi:hypothetical protein
MLREGVAPARRARAVEVPPQDRPVERGARLRDGLAARAPSSSTEANSLSVVTFKRSRCDASSFEHTSLFV